MLKNCDSTLSESYCYFGNTCGYLSSAIWFFVLFPQIIHNHQRKSVRGISNLWACMNFFASLINSLFIFSIGNMPLFSQISAVYMPILEYIFLLQIFYYHESDQTTKKKYFVILNLFILILLGVLIFLVLNFGYTLNFIEWTSIFLWSFESFPQIYLNFRLSSAVALSKFGQFITFFGKCSDVLSNYLLMLPYQYRFLGFFSTTNAHICTIQVIYYFYRDFKKKNEDPENEDFERNAQFPNENKEKNKNIIKFAVFAMIGVVVVCCVGTGYGLLRRADNYWVGIPVLVAEYVFVLGLFITRKWNMGNNRGNGYVAIDET